MLPFNVALSGWVMNEFLLLPALVQENLDLQLWFLREEHFPQTKIQK